MTENSFQVKVNPDVMRITMDQGDEGLTEFCTPLGLIFACFLPKRRKRF